MKLKNRNKYPPGGFPYQCPKCPWKVPNPMGQWSENVKAIALHRDLNPDHKLASSVDAVEEDYEEQVCLKLGKSHLWCMEPVEVQVREKLKTQKQTKGCPTCGRKRRSR